MIKNLPNTITSLNLLSGIWAIIFAYEEKPSYAVLAIVIAVIFDALDGRVARMLGISSDFGKELDSLADIVTFGAAPAFLVYTTTFNTMGVWGMAMTAIFPICGALRLARFNTETHKVKNHFIGLPITAAGMVLALFAANPHLFNVTVLSVLVFALSFLMISHIRVPNFKRVRVPKHVYLVSPLMLLVMYGLSRLFPVHFPLLLLIPVTAFLIIMVSRTRSKASRKVTSGTEKEEEI